MDDFITKPIDPEHLRQAIKKWGGEGVHTA
ncbi:MAG: hypothetical protein RL514_1815 [Verrucomicrobiota bacterium]|jgi:CheY-like chemotaxis protein